GLAPWQVSRVKAHIETGLTSALRIHDLAPIAQLSASHFCRAFKHSFGETLHAYVVRRRIERALDLMVTTDRSLNQIARACGLCDQAHFSRVFRRLVGDTPREWRRRWAGNCRREGGVPFPDKSEATPADLAA